MCSDILVFDSLDLTFKILLGFYDGISIGILFTRNWKLLNYSILLKYCIFYTWILKTCQTSRLLDLLTYIFRIFLLGFYDEIFIGILFNFTLEDLLDLNLRKYFSVYML